MYGGEGMFPFRVDDLAAISRSLLQHLKERFHFSGGVPAVPESMGRQQHDHMTRKRLQTIKHVGVKKKDVLGGTHRRIVNSETVVDRVTRKCILIVHKRPHLARDCACSEVDG